MTSADPPPPDFVSTIDIEGHLLVSTLSVDRVGYGAGMGQDRYLLPTGISVILIASVILLIMDLDRPRRGLIKVSQQSMVHLQESLKRILP